MIGGQVNCNECGKRCRTMHNLKIHKCNKRGMNCRTTQILRLENDRIASRLQSKWKEIANIYISISMGKRIQANQCGHTSKI